MPDERGEKRRRKPIRGVRTRSRASLARVWLGATWRSRARRELFDGVRNYAAFVGYARSGSSLVGALLDAHPQAILANELDAFGFLSKGFGRRQLYQLLLENSRDFAAQGGEWTGYSYAVPGQWQGRFRELRVIGDKKAGVSGHRLRRDPSLLDRMRRTVGVPLKLIHVVRNPFDNLATRIRRQTKDDVEAHLVRYFKLLWTVQSLKDMDEPPEMIDIRSEDMIADPRTQLRRLLEFLELDQDEEYLEAAAGIVYPSPRRSRDEYDWPDGVRERIEEGMKPYRFLDGYSFD